MGHFMSLFTSYVSDLVNWHLFLVVFCLIISLVSTFGPFASSVGNLGVFVVVMHLIFLIVLYLLIKTFNFQTRHMKHHFVLWLWSRGPLISQACGPVPGRPTE